MNSTPHNSYDALVFFFPQPVGSGDYSAKETIFTFSPAGPVSFTETVQVLDDNTVENRERFFVGLSAPAGETALSLPEDASVVYIADDDSELTT